MLKSVRPRHFTLGAAFLLFGLLTACTAPPGESWGNYTLTGQYIYVANRDMVFRVDTITPGDITNTTRAVDWVAKLPNNTHMYAAPAVSADGKVFVGAYNREMYAFSPLSATRKDPLTTWDAPTAGDKFTAPGLVNEALGVVYVGQGDRGIKAYSLANGAVIASFDEPRYGVWSAPVLSSDGNTLYVTSMDHSIYALDAATLRKIWGTSLGAAIGGTPLLADDVLYVGTFGSSFKAIDAIDGRELRSLTTDGWVWATPVLEDGVLYFGDLKGFVYAVDAQNFTVIWKIRDPDHPDRAVLGKVALATRSDEVRAVFVGSESKFMRAYRADTGAYLCGNQAEERIFSDLVVIGTDVIFTTLSDNQILTGYNIDTCQKTWTVKRPNDDDMNRLAGGPAPVMPTPAPATAEATAEPTAEATAAK